MITAQKYFATEEYQIIFGYVFVSSVLLPCVITLSQELLAIQSLAQITKELAYQGHTRQRNTITTKY